MSEHDTAASPAAEPDVTLESSTGIETNAEAVVDVKTEEAPPSLLDVITSVVEPKTEEALAEASSATDPVKSEAEKAEGDAAQAEQPETFEDLPFGRHPRFKEVLTERNTARTQVKTLETQVSELQGPAENYSRIETFLEQNGITNEEMVHLFKVQALAKSDPEAALKELSPLLANLYERTGAFLPDDLKTDVEEGKITEDRARELARTRAREAEATARATRAEERRVEVERSTETASRTAAFETTLSDWEAAKKVKDPDYAAKEDLIADRCRSLIAAKGEPKDADEMIAILDQAHTDVTAHLRKFVPAREEIRRGPTGPSTSNATVVPKTLLEAVTAAAAQGR